MLSEIGSDKDYLNVYIVDREGIHIIPITDSVPKTGSDEIVNPNGLSTVQLNIDKPIFEQALTLTIN